MARAIRQDMQEHYGPAFGKYLKRLRTFRTGVIKDILFRAAERTGTQTKLVANHFLKVLAKRGKAKVAR